MLDPGLRLHHMPSAIRGRRWIWRAVWQSLGVMSRATRSTAAAVPAGAVRERGD